MLALTIVLACKPAESQPVEDPGDTDEVDDSVPTCVGTACSLPSPYTSLTFEIEEVEVQTPTTAAGYQGKMVRRDSDGTLFYVYLKDLAENANVCDTPPPGSGDAAPGANYEIHLGIRAPADSDWTLETVPLDQLSVDVPYVTTRYGLDAAMDGDDLVLAFAGGETTGSLSCSGSGDLIVATRNGGSGTWAFTTAAVDSSACCGNPDPCEAGGYCTEGTDVGPWAAVTIDGGGDRAVMFMDYHFGVGEADMSNRGLELWEEGAISGIRPWSGKGTYGVLRWVAGSDFTGLLAAYSTSNQIGVYVARRVDTDGVLADWVEQNLFSGFTVGERLSMAVAPDGTVGLAVNSRQNNLGATTEDLLYCWSTDDGITWSSPCETVDYQGTTGRNPSLAYDSQSRPAISYYYCGSNNNCSNKSDGLRFAWRNPDATPNPWQRWNVRSDDAHRDGTYTQLVIDPDTDEPLIAYQDVTIGAALVARGALTGGN